MKKIIHFLSGSIFLITVLLFTACFSDGPGGDSLNSSSEDGTTETSLALNELSLSGVTLSPSFTPTVQNYTGLAGSSCKTVTVSARSRDREAQISINGGDITEGFISKELSLNETETNITVTVSSKEGNSAQQYSVCITREKETALLENGSFEEYEETGMALHWEMNSSGSLLSEEVSFAMEGSRAARFSNLTQSVSGREALSKGLAVGQNMNIRASVYCYLPEDFIDDNTGRVSVSLKLYYFRDEACTESAETASYTLRSRKLSGEALWHQVSFTREAGDIPADAAFVRLAIRACYDKETGSKNSVVWFDRASLLLSGNI